MFCISILIGVASLKYMSALKFPIKKIYEIIESKTKMNNESKHKLRATTKEQDLRSYCKLQSS